MNRRRFLGHLALTIAGSGALAPQAALALLDCRDFPAQGMRQCEAGIDSNVLQVTAAAVGGQHMTQWCWAACIEMIFRYYGYSVSQERIVASTWGDIVNLPADPRTILQNLNRHWSDDRNRDFTVQGDVYSANVVTAAQDLSNDMPLIIGTMGHAMVLTSMVYYCAGWNGAAWSACGVNAAVVRDPWPGKGRRVLAPEEWMNTYFLARVRVRPM